MFMEKIHSVHLHEVDEILDAPGSPTTFIRYYQCLLRLIYHDFYATCAAKDTGIKIKITGTLHAARSASSIQFQP